MRVASQPATPVALARSFDLLRFGFGVRIPRKKWDGESPSNAGTTNAHGREGHTWQLEYTRAMSAVASRRLTVARFHSSCCSAE